MPAGEPVRHQVFEISVVRARVSKYRLHGECCTACSKARWATLPAGASRGQLGLRALALIGVLSTEYRLPQGKLRNLLALLLIRIHADHPASHTSEKKGLGARSNAKSFGCTGGTC